MQEHETIQTTGHCDVDDVGFGLSQSSTSRLKAVDGTELLGTSHGSEATIATVGETKQLSEEYDDSDAEVGNDFSSGVSTSANDQSDHIFRDFQPHQYTTKILQRQRVLHGFKVACAVLLASQFVLIDSLNAQLKGTGNWVVITVVIVTLQTPGDTLHKILNRTAGTLVAAVLALLVGMLGRLMSESIPPAGQVFIAITNFLGAFLGTWLSSQVGKWYYAFLLGTITYVFITLSVLQEGSSVAFFRVLMIIVGGIIGLLVAWLPPNVRASEVARAYLADALVDTAVCAELVVHNFLTGRTLNPIYRIHKGEQDDTFHKLSMVIIVSRVLLEDAIAASLFEGARKLGKGVQSSGLAVRLVLRPIMSADVLLRQPFRALDQSNEDEARLAGALTNVVASLRAEFGKKVVDLDFELPPGFHTESQLSLPTALNELTSALHQYVQNGAQWTEENNVLDGFASHVSFSRLVYDAGLFVLEVSPPIKRARVNVTSDDELAVL